MLFDFLIILVLALVGIGLIILEIFLIPGFGITGIAGIAFMGGAIWFSYTQMGLLVGNITLAICLIALIWGIYQFIHSKMLNKVSLHKEIDSTAPNAITTDILIGSKGKTLSVVNPMGTVLINGHSMEAKSEEGFIDYDRDVEVVRIGPTYVIVKPL